MNTLLVTARAVHYASAMVLLGELVFAIAIAPFAWRGAASRDAGDSVRILSVVVWSVVAGLASGAVWFVVEAAMMSGTPLPSAMNRETLGIVLRDTSFGRVWTLRAGLLVALCLIGVAMRRPSFNTWRPVPFASGVLVAAAYLGSLAWAGHAVGGQGPGNEVQIAADVVHLLAAGAWLGSLPALVVVLGESRLDDVAARAAQRFSTLGVVCVTALIASGLVNAWYQVGALPALFGTLYGRLLLAKLALFAAMIVVAVVNRGYLTPRVAEADAIARRSLRRNVLLEVGLGLGIIVVVSRLGITVPAAHQPTLWPFERTLSTLPMEQSAWIQLVLPGAGMIAFVAAIFLVKGILGRPPRVRLGTLAAIAVPAGLCVWLLVAPAHPTTYLTSPVGYTTNAVATGAALYASNCSGCHGREGRRDGTEAVSLPVQPKDLAGQVPDRREGDLYWSIAHGIPGTPMPGFGSRLTDVEIWNLIQFLDAQAAARNAQAMTDRVQPLLPIPAPDFPYELPGHPQQTLLGSRDNRVTLLVLYTLPQSLPRLVDLATNARAYANAGARVIAVPMDAARATTDAESAAAGSESILASAGADVAAAYAMFAQPRATADAGPPEHVEYLIDRDGRVRVCWIGLPDLSSDRGVKTLAQIDVLFREPPQPPPPWGHRH